MNRLNLAVLAAVSALAAGGAVSRAGAQTPPGAEAVQIKATDLGRRTWMLEGQGGNITVIAGDDGVIIVDTQFAPLHDKIKAAVAKLSPQPIRYVVDTHYHGDHVLGTPLPPATQGACRRLARLAGADLLGIDLVADPAGRWKFAGANPLPDLRLGGPPLLDALAQLLRGRVKS